jgi:hypothetical protein
MLEPTTCIAWRDRVDGTCNACIEGFFCSCCDCAQDALRLRPTFFNRIQPRGIRWQIPNLGTTRFDQIACPFILMNAQVVQHDDIIGTQDRAKYPLNIHAKCVTIKTLGETHPRYFSVQAYRSDYANVFPRIFRCRTIGAFFAVCSRISSVHSKIHTAFIDEDKAFRIDITRSVAPFFSSQLDFLALAFARAKSFFFR